jgi:hypothetical protein
MAAVKASEDYPVFETPKSYNIEMPGGEDIYTKYRDLPTELKIIIDGKVVGGYKGFGLPMPAGAYMTEAGNNGLHPSKEALNDAQSPYESEKLYYWTTEFVNSDGTPNTDEKKGTWVYVDWLKSNQNQLVTISTRDGAFSGTYQNIENDMYEDGLRALAIELIKAEQSQAGKKNLNLIRLFCLTMSYAQIFRHPDCNQNRCTAHRYKVILQKARVNYRTINT